MWPPRASFALFAALPACVAPAPAPSPQRFEPAPRIAATSAAGAVPAPIAAAATTAPSSPPPSGRHACHTALSSEGCRAGPPQRPLRERSREHLFSTDGKTVFYYRQRTDFDTGSLFYADATGCPLWGDVFAWDKRDVYVLEPQSCGGERCGGDYTGYVWGPMGVRDPGAFRWLPGGYGSDGHHVYHRWYRKGPLEGVEPARFQVLLCGGEESGFAVGQEGDRFYRDGRLVTEAEAFEPRSSASP
jgi:hypothetical protein